MPWYIGTVLHDEFSSLGGATRPSGQYASCNTAPAYHWSRVANAPQRGKRIQPRICREPPRTTRESAVRTLDKNTSPTTKANKVLRKWGGGVPLLGGLQLNNSFHFLNNRSNNSVHFSKNRRNNSFHFSKNQSNNGVHFPKEKSNNSFHFSKKQSNNSVRFPRTDQIIAFTSRETNQIIAFLSRKNYQIITCTSRVTDQIIAFTFQKNRPNNSFSLLEKPIE